MSAQAFSNIADVEGKYEVVPGEVPKDITAQSDPSIVDVIDVPFTMSVDKAEATTGEILSYTIDINNLASLDINQVIVSVEIADHTTLIPDSVQPAGDIVQGINLGTIIPDQSGRITFQVTINNDAPDTIVTTATLNYKYTDSLQQEIVVGPIVEQATTFVEHVHVNLVKAVVPEFAQLNDVAIYTLSVKNQSTVPLENLLVKDAELVLIYNETLAIDAISLTIDGISQVVVGDLLAGIQIGILPVNSIAIVRIETTLIKNDRDTINNIFIGDYTYTVNGITKTITDASSNFVTLNCIRVQLDIQKVANPVAIDLSGGEVTYLVIVKNMGNVRVGDVIITDVVPDGMIYIPGTTVINGNPPIDANPEVGVNIGALNPWVTVTMEFKVEVLNV